MLKSTPKTEGIKENENILIEKDPRELRAAGLPSCGKLVKYYQLQDEINGLFLDVLNKPECSHKIRKSVDLINPLMKGQDVVEEFKETSYNSYWKKPLDIEYAACLDFSTTYNDMMMPGQEVDTRLRAGLPSGRCMDFRFEGTPS
ncbi:hypothetical protein B5X24_HaOG209647 [Helicoverpa armigera]|uniref:Uncharacterized protein n=1 Tax=Helicoverpa armigera TaxID=29058 RepID=A0A2W1BKX7_HELAM|nr:hypothetical protein B5X24_HaOG209647 [Helicoverpa armigera]